MSLFFNMLSKFVRAFLPRSKCLLISWLQCDFGVQSDFGAQGIPMVLVSNFYGNISCVLQEFGLDKFFPRIVESAVVGIRKPDPRIFELGVEALQRSERVLESKDILVVGDSFYKDILPAKQAGCQTTWFKGEGWTQETYDETIPDRIITDLSDLLSLIR